MKGFKEYVEKYGLHFTEKLASDVVECRWKPYDILLSSEEQVYYNIGGATDGDIIYMVNDYYYNTHLSKRKCIKDVLTIIENVRLNGGTFSLWALENRDFDYTSYI